MLSPVHSSLRRVQAEFPLIQVVQISRASSLKTSELELISAHKMSVAVVFQHHNDAASTFESEGRGKIDAERSLELASSYAQPKGSAIYFGVDGVDAKFFSKFHKLKKNKRN